MTDETQTTAAAPSTVIELELTNVEGKHSFDCASIPAEVRLQLLMTATKAHIANRVNAAHQRYLKDAKVIAWNAYEEACKADPLQSVVAKPTEDKPAAPDYLAIMQKAMEDLRNGELRKQGTGEKKPRERKDPLIQMVTRAVVNDVYESKKGEAGYTYFKAQKEVGKDGVEYLNARIDTLVAAGADRAALEKMRDEKYIKPASLMLGITENKATKGLPNLLG
jgi:hypothetical protein